MSQPVQGIPVVNNSCNNANYSHQQFYPGVPNTHYDYSTVQNVENIPNTQNTQMDVHNKLDNLYIKWIQFKQE